MLWIDTHTHLYSEEFEADWEEMVARALAAGVDQLFLPNIDEGSIAGMLDLEARYPEHIYAMMGIHPCYVREEVEEQLDLVKAWLQQRPFRAIGEIGLDFYWDKSLLVQQYKAFQEQLALAREHGLPVSIHSREATRECINEVKALQDGRLTGVFHCFSGTLEEAKEIIDLGFYLGIGGVVTFKKSGLGKLLEEIDLSHIVMETDAPYLAPVPYRGKRNESAYLPLAGEKVADIKNLKIEEVAAITSSNARKLFKML